MSSARPVTPPQSPLDPADWSTFRASAHQLLDQCIDHLSSVRERPWHPLEQADKAALGLQRGGADGIGLDALAEELVEKVLPFSTGNTHPRFYAWVHGTGLASGLLAEIIAATMNSNCGGRDHGAVYVEREVIRWCAETLGFPQGSSGVLVTGTSQATVLALAIARQQALGLESRQQGISQQRQLTAYAVDGVHNATTKAMELLGIGSAYLRKVPADDATGGMDTAKLAQMVKADRAEGFLPFCIVGTAGSVDLGRYDLLDEIATYAQKEKLWFHVDGAFGAWAKIAQAPWCDLVRGMERADSIALDFHKWMYVQYDCGLVLIRDENAHRAAFAARPAYLAAQEAGLGGGEPWFCDYGTDLSRGFRALKVWASIRAYGRDAFSLAITENCKQAALMAQLVQESEDLILMAPTVSNVCCFSVRREDVSETSLLNKKIVQRLQLAGEAFFSTTTLAGRTVIRAAITNHRSTHEDVLQSIRSVQRLLAEMGK